MERELIELLKNKNGRVRTKVMREFKARINGTWDDVRRKVNCTEFFDEYRHTINYLKRKENKPEQPRIITIDEIMEYLKVCKDRCGSKSHLRLSPKEAEQVLEWLADYQKNQGGKCMRLTPKGWMILYGILSGIAIYYIRKCTRLEEEIDELRDLIEMSVEVVNDDECE